MSAKKTAFLRLSPPGHELLHTITDRWGLTISGTVEVLLRQEAHRLGLIEGAPIPPVPVARVSAATAQAFEVIAAPLDPLTTKLRPEDFGAEDEGVNIPPGPCELALNDLKAREAEERRQRDNALARERRRLKREALHKQQRLQELTDQHDDIDEAVE